MNVKILQRTNVRQEKQHQWYANNGIEYGGYFAGISFRSDMSIALYKIKERIHLFSINNATTFFCWVFPAHFVVRIEIT